MKDPEPDEKANSSSLGWVYLKFWYIYDYLSFTAALGPHKLTYLSQTD